jgi:acyl-homoserine lactone acylase PvdQ
MTRASCYCALLLAALLPGAAHARDYAGTALNILPPGQHGAVPPPAGADREARMYDALTPLFDQVTTADLAATFKSSRLGAADSCPCRTERVPRRGVRIVRDRFNVPHITARNKRDLAWASGWVLQQDRGLLLAVGRYPARLAALDAPGVDAFSLVTGLKQVTVTRQADRIIAREQTRALRALGAEGRSLLRDVDAYVDGLNARLRRERSNARPFRRVDVYAINALAGQIFGQGGGEEVRRSMLLDALRDRLGDRDGTVVFNDLAAHDDGDSPTTLTRRFPYAPVPARASGSAIVDDGSIPAARVRSGGPRTASNFLMVSRRRSTNGHPLFVAGPQVGYFYPGLLLEMDLRAPGIEARGAAMPGGAGNILIGRGPDFAWSLTSAGADTNDQYVETLCGGSRFRYRYKGRCRTMGTVNAGTIAGQGRVRFRTTVHGPVQGWARVGGRQVAISLKRSSRGRDILWQVGFKRMTDGRVRDVRSFYAAAATSPLTYNVAYADDRDIAVFTTGRLPIRDRRVDPRLPTRGTGEYEWRGFLRARDHPQQANPPSGKLNNWNNRPAPAFASADDQWTWGSIQRVQLLDDAIAQRPTHDLASVVAAMNKAATQDLRAAGSLLPAIVQVLRTGPAPSERSQRMLDALLAWRDAGASRLDRDLDGRMDAGAAPAIMDAVYPRVADAVLAPVLGPQLEQLSAIVGATTGPARGFTSGRMNLVDKDLRQLAGETFRTPLRTPYCGRGDMAACRDALWQAFEQAGAALAAAQGGEDPAGWTSDANAERIAFAPGLLPTTIRYTNRPSGIQQVMTFTGHRPRARGR